LLSLLGTEIRYTAGAFQQAQQEVAASLKFPRCAVGEEEENRIVREAAKKHLQSYEGEGKKPN
jgi:hypothetical protein